MNYEKRKLQKQGIANSIKADVINRFLDDLASKELKECEQARKYISRFGFTEVEKYSKGSKELEGGTVFCSADCRQHYYY